MSVSIRVGLFYVLAVAICFDVIQARCPNGWIVYEDSCYLYLHEHVHFIEAETGCRQRGAHLVHIETSAENEFLKSEARIFGGSFWIGLTDQISEGHWKWYDTDTVATFLDFNPGEPNDGISDNCAQLWPSANYAWADDSCTETFQPLCERSRETESVIG